MKIPNFYKPSHAILSFMDKITDLFCGHLLIPAVTDDNICTLSAKPGGNSFKTTLLTCNIQKT